MTQWNTSSAQLVTQLAGHSCAETLLTDLANVVTNFITKDFTRKHENVLTPYKANLATQILDINISCEKFFHSGIRITNNYRLASKSGLEEFCLMINIASISESDMATNENSPTVGLDLYNEVIDSLTI